MRHPILRFATIVRIGVICTGLSFAPGCRKTPSATSDPNSSAGISRNAVRGPVSLAVQTDRSKATIAERFTLTITAVADDGVDVTMPQFGDALGAFSVRDFQQTEARPIEGGKRQWQQVYQIDCELSGKYPVKPITVSFNDRRGRAAQHAGATTSPSSRPGVQASVSTEGFDLEVTSLLEGQFDPNRFYDVKGPTLLPEPPARWYWWVLGGTALAAVLTTVAVLMIRRWRGKGPLTIQIPPHEWAMDELQRLLDDDLIGWGDVQAFYYRLNAIVRQYIELRFELMAPEMTTEEFLDALRGSDRLSLAHKSLLQDFLTACDPVKYARYVPGKEEIEQVFDAARNLIEQTAQRGKGITSSIDESVLEESAA